MPTEPSQSPCAIAPWYGTLVWRNGLRGVFRSASAASYFCIGAGANVVWIDPDRQMVAVARWIDGAQIDGFCRRVNEAVEVAQSRARSGQLGWIRLLRYVINSCLRSYLLVLKRIQLADSVIKTWDATDSRRGRGLTALKVCGR